MKPFGSEACSLIAVSAVSCAVVLAIPSDAFRFRASESVGPAASLRAPVSFVNLDAKTEVELVRAAKNTWRKGTGLGRIYADLALTELPEDALPPILSLESRSRPPEPPVAVCETPPFLPSLRAEPPTRLPPAGKTDELTFSRNELLGL